jgi:2-dehydropantoate 2-reductase
MRIAVVGAGGLGGYYGGRLAKAGHDVTFIARGEQLAALRANGLRVESVRDPFHLPTVSATGDAKSAGPVDLVLLTVKAYDLARAAEGILPLIAKETAVLPLLNGVDISERIGAVIGMPHVLGGLAYVFSYVAEPGVIKQVSPFDRIQFGEPGGGLSERGSRIEAALREAGIEAEQVADIQAALWTKFMFLAPSSGMATLTRLHIGLVRSDPDTRAMLIEAMKEIEAVARAKHIALKPGILAEMIARMDGLPTELKPSMALDLDRGRPLEIEALSGTVARMGREMGIPTPINAFIYTALKLHMHGRPSA